MKPEEQVDLIRKQMNMQLDMLEGNIPRVAKINKKYFDELIAQGFNQEQAMQILLSFKVT